MKKIIAIGFLFAQFVSFGQTQPQLRLGYLQRLAMQPGVLVEYNQSLKALNKGRSFYWAPSIGVYTRVNYNTNALLGAEFGIRREKEESAFFHNWGLSAHYLFESEVLATTVNLQGDIVGKNRASRHYFLPMINYSFGHHFDNGWGWFMKLSGGMKLSGTHENVALGYTTIGVCKSLNFSK